MKRLNIHEAERLALKLRAEMGLNASEPINVKTALRQLRILTMYRPMSATTYGISVRSHDNDRFILVNSNSTRGRQHFTIAHELYHLYYDEKPVPHLCADGFRESAERNADLFASAFLMPSEGLRREVNEAETRSGKVTLATVLRLEQLFGVSRLSLLVRLKDIGLIDGAQLEELRQIPAKESARAYGYELSLYEPGNEGCVIGDFGEKARTLFERGVISEGHYVELLNMITHEQ